MKLTGKFLQSRRNQLIIVILITLLTYINILQNGFAWDDRDFLIDWPQIKSEQGLPAYLSIPALLQGDLPLNHKGVYRPLRSIYQLVSYSFWGQNPLPYHIQAIIVHILIVVTIYLITELITQKRLPAFIVSVFFATHPIHTEAVTFTAASFDTLGILFFFLSFYFYLKQKKDKFKKNIYLSGSIIYGFFSFLIYEMTLVLPILILLYDFCTNNFSLKKLIPKIHIYKYYFLILAAYFLIRFIILGIGNRADYLGDTWQIAANQARVGMPEIFKNYLLWLIWPVNLSQRPDMPVNFLTGFLYLLNKIDPGGKLITLSARIVFLFPLFYTLIGIILSYIFLKKYPLVFFGVAWIMIALLPVANIIPQGAAVAERFLYIPSFGFTFLLGLFFYRGFYALYKNRKYKYLSYLLIAILPSIVAFYTYQTISRNTDWKDEKTIWQSLAKNNPENPVPYAALAAIYARENQYNTAIGLYKRALEFDESAKLNSDLGLAYEKTGDLEKAIAQHQKALNFDPQFYLAHLYLGNIYQQQQSFDLAVREYKSALDVNKNDYRILSSLGIAYYNQKKYDKAIETFNKSLELNSKQSLVYLILEKIYQLK